MKLWLMSMIVAVCKAVFSLYSLNRRYYAALQAVVIQTLQSQTEARGEEMYKIKNKFDFENPKSEIPKKGTSQQSASFFPCRRL